jgi:hypothetical protein
MGFLAAAGSGAGATGAAAAGTTTTGAAGAGAAGTATTGSVLGPGLTKAFQVMSELKKQGLMSGGGGGGGSGLNSKVDLVPVQFSSAPQTTPNAQDFINAMLARR